MTQTDQQLAEMLARRFIARRDVKAVQNSNGGYRPVTSPFQMADLIAHVQGKATFGHYLLDQHNMCKFFAFDIDLNEGDCENRTKEFIPPCCEAGHGNWLDLPSLEAMPPEDLTHEEASAWMEENTVIRPARPRDAWRDRSHPGRTWWKTQMRSLSDMLASRIRTGLGIPALVTYTGGKGVHVYGFTGHLDAENVRAGAIHVLESLNRFKPVAGQNFYGDTNTHWYDSFAANLTIEVFPKQTTVEPGHYGNLMRLPFGRNLKNPHDPTFIVDERAPGNMLVPLKDPYTALESMSPFTNQPRWGA